MMFSLRLFVKEGFIKAVGKMADYQIVLNAAGWHEKGVLLEDDLAEIQTAIEAQYIVVEEDVADEATGNEYVEEEVQNSENTMEGSEDTTKGAENIAEETEGTGE